MPFNREHSYVRTQVPFSEQRADPRASVMLERSQWYIAFSVTSKHLSSAKEGGSTEKSKPNHLFFFSATTANLEFLSSVLGLC